MSTKLTFLIVLAISLLFISIQAKTTDPFDYDEELGLNEPGLNEPEVDYPMFIESSEASSDNEEQTDAATVGKSNDAAEDTSSTDESDLSEDEKTHNDGVVADGEYHPFFMDKCEYAEVILEKKAIEITVNPVFNTKTVIITSTPFAKCEDISEYNCQQGSFCKVQNLEDGDDTVKLGSEACDVDVLYVYPLADEPDVKMELEIKATMNDEEIQCDSTSSSKTPLTPISDDDGNSSTAASTNVDSDDTDNEASGATSTSEDSDETKQDTSAEASATADSADSEKPTDSAGQKDKKTKKDKSSTETDEATPQDDEDQSTSGGINIQHPIGRIIALVVGSLFALFVMIVCFYRCQFRKHGEGPFNPPSCCPNCLFPRHKEDGFVVITTDKRQEMMEYQPPVPVL